MWMLIFHLHVPRVTFEGKIYLAKRGRLLIFACIDYVLRVESVIDLFIGFFCVHSKVNIWLNFSDFINTVIDWFYWTFEPYFSELSFGVVFQIKVKEIFCLCYIVQCKHYFGVTIAKIPQIPLLEMVFPYYYRFGTAILQIFGIIVDQLAVSTVEFPPADQVSFLEVNYRWSWPFNYL